MHFGIVQKQLESVLVFWVVGGFVSAIVSAVFVFTSKEYTSREGGGGGISFGWIKLGLLVALPLMLSTLVVRGLLSFDKVWLLQVSSHEMVGAYVLVVTIANALIAFLEAGLFSFVYPRLIELKSRMKINLFVRQLVWLHVNCVLAVIAFGGAFLFFVPYVIEWSGKAELAQYVGVKGYVLFYIACFAVGMAAQYGLYALELDRFILISHLSGGMVFFIAWLVAPQMGGVEVLLTVCTSFFLILVLKLYFLVKSLFALCGNVREGR